MIHSVSQHSITFCNKNERIKNNKNATFWLFKGSFGELTGFKVKHFGDKAVVRDGELGQFQFVQAVDVSLAL